MFLLLFGRGIISRRIAIVHDWLTGMRGGEKVLDVIAGLYPDATLFTLLHLKGSVSPRIERMDIRTSFIQRLPSAEKRYRHYLPLFPRAAESFDLRDYDLVVSISHCVAKGVRPGPNAVHLSYVLSPMRYMWDLFDDYFGPGRAGGLTRAVARLLRGRLRAWDVRSAERVSAFGAISNHIAAKIKRFYSREAEVIYPPADCGFYNLNREGEDFYLIVSAFAPYKKVNIAVEAFNRLGWKLKIIGTGQDEKRLKAMADPNIEFLGWQDSKKIREYYSRCRALVFPGEEDYGIVPVEAMASGKPVIAYANGGALETVSGLNGSAGTSPTGILFNEQTPSSLIEAIERFETSADRFDPKAIRERALLFDEKIFREKIYDFIEKNYEMKKLKRRENA